MKKQLLTLALVLVGLMSSLNSWAAYSSSEYMGQWDSMKDKDLGALDRFRLVSDIKYNPQTGILSFQDDFNGITASVFPIRNYTIHVYEWSGWVGTNKQWVEYSVPFTEIMGIKHYDYKSKTVFRKHDSFDYDMPFLGNANTQKHRHVTTSDINFPRVEVYMPEILEKAFEKGVTDVHVVIETQLIANNGSSRDAQLEKFGSTYGRGDKLYLANYEDFYFPAAVLGHIQKTSSTVRYKDGKTNLTCNVHAAHACNLYWEVERNGNWVAVEGRALSAEEARAGYTATHGVSVSNAGATSVNRRLHVVVHMPNGNDVDIIREMDDPLLVAYPITVDGVSYGWANAGERVENVTYSHPCAELQFDCKLPVEAYYITTGNSEVSSLAIDMPAAPLNITHVTPSFTVCFWDGQNNKLKEQTVLCGDAATAPSVPSRSGYTFLGWSQNFETVKSNLNISALWDYNAYSATAELVGHGSKFNVMRNLESAYLCMGDTLRFKATVKADKAVTYYLEYKRDNEAWKTSSSIAVSFTQAEAKAGTSKNIQAIPFRVGMDGYYKMSVRYKVEAGSTTSYTTAYTYNLCYPIEYYPRFEAVVTNDFFNDTIPAGNDWVKIPCEIADTIYVSRTDGLNDCSMLDESNMTNSGKTQDGRMWCVASNFSSQSFQINGSYKLYVTFSANGGTMPNPSLAYQTISCGTPVQDPGVPTRNGYTFAGWDKDFEHLRYEPDSSDNVIIKAQWLEIPPYITHHVTFMGMTVSFDELTGEDISTPVVLKEEDVAENENATAPLNTEVDGYIFTGWDKEYYNIQEDLTITAQYEKVKLSGNPEDGIREILAEHDVPNQKVMINGMLYIIHAGRIYDAQGRLVE